MIETDGSLRRQTANARFSTSCAAVLMLFLLSACGSESDTASEASDSAGSRTGLTAAELATEAPATESGAEERRVDADGRDSGEVSELDWDALIPEEWRPETLLEGLNEDGAGLDDISDEDPRAEAVMDKLLALWKQAPVVDALDGKKVKLPGFVVPLEFDLNDVSEFLLVPYYGACIHVPPPPANQTVHVVLPQDKTYRGGVFDTVWVTGILRIERFSSDIAEAGYRLEALEIAPYP